MSLVSSRVALRHQCTIERDTSVGPDSWGQSGEPNWVRHLINIPCRAWTDAAREPVDDTKTVVMEDRRVIVEIGTDVTERDRVASVTNPAGTVIFEGPINIEGVQRYPDHLELLLERIR
jgi:hypothetical protein